MKLGGYGYLWESLLLILRFRISVRGRFLLTHPPPRLVKGEESDNVFLFQGNAPTFTMFSLFAQSAPNEEQV